MPVATASVPVLNTDEALQVILMLEGKAYDRATVQRVVRDKLHTEPVASSTGKKRLACGTPLAMAAIAAAVHPDADPALRAAHAVFRDVHQGAMYPRRQ